MTTSPKKQMPQSLKYTISIPFDRRLYKYDIAGSISHVRMLGKQHIIPEGEAKVIVSGLKAIREEIDDGAFPFKEELEDIHLNIESRLFDKIGDVAGKLHTARSRNDQVALDLRMFVKDAIEETIDGLKHLQSALVDQADANRDVVIPGYTHLQQAQPVLLSHHILAYFEMIQRDVERFQECMKRADVLPLGSGALTGVSYPIDRGYVARELEFAAISHNSMDAVSDRDFIIEYESVASITMMHVSRLAEELILWSSEEFGFILLNEDYTTGSSIMPQKRNPDVAELARGKTGRVYGNLMALLTTLKALPLAYNKDLQEDKEGLFDTVDTLNTTVHVLAGMITTMKVDIERAEQIMNSARSTKLLATDLADYLAKRGLPFRQAHQVVRDLIEHVTEENKALNQVSIEEYHSFSPLFDRDVYSITIETSLASRDAPGSTAPSQVSKALARAREILRFHYE